MTTSDPERLEGLLADALAAHDDGGPAGLDAFLQAHSDDRPAIERGLARCRQLGLLGDAAPARNFPERLGEFRLLQRLGSGGMGVVYEAEQESLGRRVALKVVRPELLYFEGARERFRREIEAVARLAHPAVVPVLASGEQDGVPWYAMELLRGRTASEVCEALAGRDPALLRGEDLRKTLGPSVESGTDPLLGAWWQVCVRIVHAVALGVRHAHLRGIVHRDIKPSNVMLTTDGRTVLLDFGIAMLGGGREFTRTGATPGSPAFMSPEQLRGDAVDERTDVYSLGATLWQLLTLVPPFRGDVDLQRIRDGNVPPVTAHNREVPRELVIVLQKAMDRDRERRYVDVEQFAQDLAAVLQRRPIQARRLELTLRAWRWCQRHRVLATAATSLAVVAMALPGVFAWRERATNRELADAFTRVNQSFTTSLDAIDQMMVTLARKELRFVPAAAAASRDALARACTMYRDLLQQYPDHQRLRQDAAVALNSLADLTLQAGDRAGAEALYEESITHLGAGPIADPERLDTRATSLLNLARLHSEFSEVEPQRRRLDEAIRDYQELMAHDRWLGHAKNGLAQATLLQARLPEFTADPAARLAKLRACVELSREAFALQGSMPSRRTQLVQNLNNLAVELHTARDFTSAMDTLAQAMQLLDEMPADAHVSPSPRVQRSGLLQTRGNVRMEAKDAAANDDFTAAIELLEAERAQNVDDIELTSRLAGSLHNFARTECDDAATDEQLERALVRLRRAVELERDVLMRSPGYARARTQLMLHLRLQGNCFARLQRRAELVAVATELRTDEHNANHLRATARFWLRAAEMAVGEKVAGLDVLRPQYEDHALDALLAAEQAGWQSRSVCDEPVYAPLARLPEFAGLRERLRAKAAAAPQSR